MYAITREVSLDFDDALERVRSRLQAEGLDVLWETDVSQWLQDATGGSFPRYNLLGVGDPERAYDVLTSEPELGALFPYHVIVYEMEPGRSVVASVRPTDIFERAVRNSDVAHLVEAGEERLRDALASVGKGAGIDARSALAGAGPGRR